MGEREEGGEGGGGEGREEGGMRERRKGEREGREGTPLYSAHIERGIVGDFSLTKHQVLLLPL